MRPAKPNKGKAGNKATSFYHPMKQKARGELRKIMNSVFYDTEIFPNYFLVVLYDEQKKFREFEFFGNPEQVQDTAKLYQAIFAKDQILIGFNSHSYDNVVIKRFLEAKTILAAKTISDEIIGGNSRAIEKLTPNSLDVLGILDRKASLKLFECRLGLSKVLETPQDFNKPVEAKDLQQIKEYCKHDVFSTATLFQTKIVQEKLACKQQASLDFKLDLTSLSESEIASKIVERELISKTKISTKNLENPSFVFLGRDVINSKISFDTALFQKALDHAREFKFQYLDKSGKKVEGFEIEIPLENLTLNLASGGIHSVGKSKVIADLHPGESILDFDVSSFYPSTILIEQIAPSKVKAVFLSFYKSIVENRLQAKANGQKAKADTFKIVLNATYGKFGDKHSFLYNPKNMVAVTLNCQFRILQLIEKVISVKDSELLQANTDGITIFCKTPEAKAMIETATEAWQKLTGYTLEKTEYNAMIMADVSNYVALKPDGKRKEKGHFATDRNLFGGGSTPLIIPKAVQAYLFHGIPLSQTIKRPETTSDLEDYVFFTQRKQTVGYGIDGYNQKVNRYVYALRQKNELKAKHEAGKEIRIAKNIHLANDYEAVNLQDIDLARYREKAKEIIDSLKPKASILPLFDGLEEQDILPTDTLKEAKENSHPLPTIMPVIENMPAIQAHKDYMEILNDWKKASKAFTHENAIRLLLDDGKRYCIRLGTLDKLGKNPWGWIEKIQPLNKASYITLNPYKQGISRHTKADIDERIAVTVEYDNINLHEQVKRLQNVPHSVICFSGSKSLHCHIRFTRALSQDESIELDSYLAAIFGDSDQSTWRKSQFVRVPGGWNYGKSKQQTILSIRDRVPPEEFLAWIKQEAQKQGLSVAIKTSKPIEGKEDNALAFAFRQFVLDSELVQKKHFKKTQGQWTFDDSRYLDGVYYTSNCPNYQSHTDQKTKDNEFSIFLATTGEIKKHCFHASCKEIWKETLPKILGFDFTENYLPAFFESDYYKNLGITRKAVKTELREYIPDKKELEIESPEDSELLERLTPRTITPEIDENSEVCTVESFLYSIRPNEVLSLYMLFGSGKTRAIAFSAILLADRGELILISTYTTQEKANILAEIKGLLEKDWLEYGEKQPDLTFVEDVFDLSSENWEKETIEKENESLKAVSWKNKKILICCHEYAGRRGNYPIGYAKWLQARENRIVFFDEAHSLTNITEIRLQLSGRYSQEGNCYYIQNSCPKSTESGSCKNCCLAYKQEFKKKLGDFSLFDKFSSEALALHSGRPDIPIEWQEIEEWQGYTQINGTLFTKFLPDSRQPYHGEITLNAVNGETPSEFEIVSGYLEHAYNPALRVEMPVSKANQAMILPGQIDDSTPALFPKYPCQVPWLVGIDTLFYKLLQTVNVKFAEGKIKTYNPVKALVFSSGEDFSEIIHPAKEALEGWTFREYKGNWRPATFDGTVLKTSMQLGMNLQAKLASALLDSNKVNGKILIVNKTKSRSSLLKSMLWKLYPIGHEGEIEAYTGKDSDETQFTPSERKPMRLLSCYAHAPILQGRNLASFDLVLIDCGFYKPFCAIHNLKPGMTKEERHTVLQEALEKRLRQILSRLLRTLLQIEQGKTIQDGRKIAYFLHNLADLNLSLNSEAFHHYQEFSENWLRHNSKAKDTIASILDSYGRILTGETPVDYLVIEAQEEKERIAKKYDAMGNHTLREKEREQITPEMIANREKLKENKTFALLLEKAKALKAEGKCWRDISRILHLNRHPEELEKIQKELGF